MSDLWRSILGPARIGVLFAILGFLIQFSNQRTITGGGTQSCSFTDFGPVLFGCGGVIVGVAALRQAGKSANPTLNYVLGGLSLAFGALHLLRGFGFVGGPCN